MTNIEDNISSTWYINGASGVVPDAHYQPPVPIGHPLYMLTICVLVLTSGRTVTGESFCASPENFDEEVERKNANANAIQKLAANGAK